uniref:Nuclear receptor interacting protein 3 n=1 Tax=Nothoprocta perdicaria TaxID=30464 RepID=A0A8C7EFK2_NOTPE
MFYSGVLTEPSRKEVELREAAALRQQRRVKQAVQFLHQDSADLLPLDGLKKLGSSKDTQPHSILQRRLMETNLSKLRSSRGPWAAKSDPAGKLHPSAPGSAGQLRQEELIVVRCQCAGQELEAVVDTGSHFNLVSSACLDRLGLSEHVKAFGSDEEGAVLPQGVRAVGRVEGLALALGAVSLECGALVLGKRLLQVALCPLREGLSSLQCIINMEKQHLVLGQADRAEIPFVEGSAAAEDER